MKKLLLTLPLMAALAGCGKTEAELAAELAEIRATKAAAAQERVVDGITYKTVCIDEVLYIAQKFHQAGHGSIWLITSPKLRVHRTTPESCTQQ